MASFGSYLPVSGHDHETARRAACGSSQGGKLLGRKGQSALFFPPSWRSDPSCLRRLSLLSRLRRLSPRRDLSAPGHAPGALAASRPVEPRGARERKPRPVRRAGRRCRRSRIRPSCRLAERGPADPECSPVRCFPERLGRERPDRAVDGSDRAVDGSDRAVDGSDRASAGAASSACDDITDRDSIPAGRISQNAPQ